MHDSRLIDNQDGRDYSRPTLYSKASDLRSGNGLRCRISGEGTCSTPISLNLINEFIGGAAGYLGDFA